MSNSYTRAQVASHNSPADLWIVVSEEIYDVTEFKETHPGGAKSEMILDGIKPCINPLLTSAVLKTVAGKDATKAFRKHHSEMILKGENYRELCIGKIMEMKVDTIEEEEEEDPSPKSPARTSGRWAKLRKDQKR